MYQDRKRVNPGVAQMKKNESPENLRHGAPEKHRPAFLEPFVDADQAARFLSLRRRHVLELARRGAIPAHPLGEGPRRVWRFRLSEVAFAISSQEIDCRGQSPAPEQENS